VAKYTANGQGYRPNGFIKVENLAVTSDFRSVIGTIVERHMGLSDQSLLSIFPEMPQAQADSRLS